MSHAWYEPLSATDRSFLLFERRSTHMHLGGVTVFDSGTLLRADGGVDIERIRAYIASRLPLIPRYRQRLAYVPWEGSPVWVDDDRFHLDYHVRHTALPRPGDEQQLKQLAGRLMSIPLDRRRPLWEAWVVEGLQHNRFAIVLKTHHAVVDGVSGVDLMATLLQPDPVETFDPAPPWRPRPAPSGAQLLGDKVLERLLLPAELWRGFRAAINDPQAAVARASKALNRSVWFLRSGLHFPSPTPLNQPIGPYRRFDWQELPLAGAKEIKNRWGGSVNDVVLATVTGAVRRYLRRKVVSLDGMEFRAVVPVSLRRPEDPAVSGNRVSAWLLALPVSEPDPLKRYRALVAETERRKRTHEERALEVFTRVAEVMNPLLTLGVRVATRLAPFNLIVTNVPGPQFPLFLLGARLLRGYPTVPLFDYQGLGVAIFSYDGALLFGLNADFDLVPDLHEFAADLKASFVELQQMREGSVTPARLRRKKGLEAVKK
ncbi:MAG: wax ester/triacylglycerol synthase family O-acyltransferase [candidate division KSB1 bacterium]|nr:wax ester/triacylglycerol synthase family O-acyltransferase [candidate division KSB1 bacterium]